MPVEIRELHIQVNINESASSNSGNSGSEIDQKVLIETVVEKILEILKEKMER